MTDITTVNAIPVIPSPKGVIFITAGQRPAVKDSHTLLLPDKAGRYPYRQRSPAFQAESRWLSYLPQAALRLPAVMEIAPSGLKLSGIELMTHNPNVKLTT